MKTSDCLKFRFSLAHFLLGIAALFLPLVATATTFEVSVGVGGNVFSPSSLTIQEGDTVRWNNPAGGMTHNVTSNNGSFPASPSAAGFVYEHTFNNAGTFGYQCTFHGGMTGTITVQSGGGGAADLAVQSIDAQNGTYEPGDSLNISVSLQNMGTVTSAGFTITFYASTNTTINASDIEIGSSARAALTASQVSAFNVTATFPGSMADGNYFIGGIIEISDSNNANNTGLDSTAVTVEASTPPPAAELQLTSVDAPSGSFAQGAAISVNAQVHNAGNEASGPFSIDYYASTNNIINTSDRLIGTENRASLAVGATSGAPFNATIPGNLAPGMYFIGAIVDYDDSDAGSNVNVDETAITVTGGGGGGFVINNGLNDTWRDINTRGQGFFVTVFPDIQKMFVGWFMYDIERPAQGVEAILGEPGHRWLTAFGSYSGDTANLDIEFTQGGIFDSGTPAPTQGPYGTLTIRWTNCGEAQATYSIPSVPVSGVIPITRVANDNVARCEAASAASTSPPVYPPPY